MSSSFFKACYKCTKRKKGCHSTCKEYKAEKAAWDDVKKQLNKEKSVDAYTNEQMANNWAKSVKAKKGVVLHFK